MTIRIELNDVEIAQLRELAAQVGRSPGAVATAAVRDWIERRVKLADIADRIITEDAELLRRLSDS